MARWRRRPLSWFPTGDASRFPRRGNTWIRELHGPSPDAPTVVLLHGLGATGALNWFPAFGALARHFRVVAMDHRGHGRGIRSRRPFRLEDCADDVAALIDELGVGQRHPRRLFDGRSDHATDMAPSSRSGPRRGVVRDELSLRSCRHAINAGGDSAWVQPAFYAAAGASTDDARRDRLQSAASRAAQLGDRRTEQPRPGGVGRGSDGDRRFRLHTLDRGPRRTGGIGDHRCTTGWCRRAVRPSSPNSHAARRIALREDTTCASPIPQYSSRRSCAPRGRSRRGRADAKTPPHPWPKPETGRRFLFVARYAFRAR